MNNTLTFRSLTLTNFKGFSGEHKFELDLAPGLYYVTGLNKLNPELGANGVGKSTLWDAMFWVLFNKTVRDARPANSIAPWDGEKAGTSVSLHFRRGMDYVLTRTRKPNSLQLERLGKSIEIPQEDVAATLGINEETFRRTIVLGQFGSLFLDLGPEQQARMFSDALDLNVWLKAADLASKRRKDADRNQAQLKLSVAASEGKLAEIAGLIAEEEAAASGFERKKTAEVGALRKKLDLHEEELEKLVQSAPETARARNKKPVQDTLAAQVVELRQLQRRLARSAGDLEGELSASRRVVAETKEKLGQYRAALAGNRRCPECNQEAPVAHLRGKLAESIKAEARATNEVSVVEGYLADKARELNQVEGQIESLEKLTRLVSAAAARMDSTKRDLDRLEKTNNHHDEQLKYLKMRRSTTRDEVKMLSEELTVAEALIETYEFWNKAFKEIRLSIIDDTLRELEMAVTRHISALGLPDWHVEFETERTTKSGDVSVSFTVLLYPPDVEEPVRFESYSGGESQRLQLAVAFGLSEVLLERAGVSPNIEVLDEPTKGLSTQGVDDLLEHLSVRAKELGRALYFVDHHSLDRGAFDDAITIVKDEKGAHIR